MSHKEVLNDSFSPHTCFMLFLYQFYHLLTKPDSLSPPHPTLSLPCGAVEADFDANAVLNRDASVGRAG